MKDSKLIKVQYLSLIVCSSLIGLMFSIHPVSAHTNHPHDSSKPTSISEPKSSVSTPQLTTETTEEPSVKMTSQTEGSSSSILPKPSEILFLLLVINPFLLYTLRNRLHSPNP